MLPLPLDADGTCKKCHKKADQEFMTCFVCDLKIHVLNCGQDDDLCTKSFLNNQWANLNKNWPSIVFVCPPCRDSKVLQTEIVASNRMSVIEDDVSVVKNDVTTMKDDLTQIKELLLTGRRGNDASDENENTDFQMTYAQKVKKPQQSVIIIKKSEEAVDIAKIQQAAINSRAAVSSAYQNKIGDTVIVCENQESKERLLPNINEVLPDHTVITPPAKQPTITITGMDSNYSKDDVFTMAQSGNQSTGININDNNFKVLFVTPHAKDPSLFQAIVRVSEEIRKQIDSNRDKICIGVTLCHVFDRFFVRRCYNCQLYKHSADKCPQEHPTCGKCAGRHETRRCDEQTEKCVNCASNGFTETNHQTSWYKCKSYINAQNKLASTINYYKNTKNEHNQNR